MTKPTIHAWIGGLSVCHHLRENTQKAGAVQLPNRMHGRLPKGGC